MAEDDYPFEIGENACEKCGEQNWQHFAEQERGESPTKHLFECGECGAHAYVFDGAELTFTGSFERAGQRHGDADDPRYSRGV